MPTLYRFAYSCYARKVQMVLDLLGREYRLVDLSYLDRDEMLAHTGGYAQVPVLVTDGGEAVVDSRAICQVLLDEGDGARLLPSPWQGPIWAYADWCDGPLEDVMFRLASPAIRERFTRPTERALFTFIKERRFGPGCVELWQRERPTLLARAQALLAPTLATLQVQPFVFGAVASLADAALYGQLVMLEVGDPALLAQLAPALPHWLRRLEAAAGLEPSAPS